MKKTGQFYFATDNMDTEGNIIEEDYPAIYHYDDNYFTGSASDYNPSLATMSLCLELSAWGSNIGGLSNDDLNYAEKYKNAEKLFSKDGIEFEGFDKNHDFTVKPKKDTMGVVIAHRNIDVDGEKFTLIALATRGGGYEAEWAGNFTIGKDGQHEGFSTAANNAYTFLAEYMDHHKFQGAVKFWITGFSRAAAAVNLLAGRLNNDGQIAGKAFSKEDVYVYCFEPPMGVLLSQVVPKENYANIHNIVNPSDPVPKVAPRDWGFGRYGLPDEKVIPTELTSSNSEHYDKMLKYFDDLKTQYVEESFEKDEITGERKQPLKHIINTFQAKKFNFPIAVKIEGWHWEMKTAWHGVPYLIYVPNFKIDLQPIIGDDTATADAVLDKLITSLASGIGDRVFYTSNLQSFFELVIGETLGKGYESYKWDKVKKIFRQKLKAHLFDIAVGLIGSVNSLNLLIADYMFESIADAGIDLNTYTGAPVAFKDALASIISTIVSSIILHGASDLLTLIYNLDKIFPAHYPELCLAWLQSQDKNYEEELKTYINAYRIIRINGSADVSVADSKGTQVAQIVNDVPQKIDDSMIHVGINANSEKVIYLPADEDYTIKITITENGTLDYSVNEFSFDTNAYAKIVAYYDIPVTVGDILEGKAPKFTPQDIANTGEGSGAHYSLSNSTGELTSTTTKVGESARNATYSVKIGNRNSEGGYVMGGGIFPEGAFAQAAAVPYETCKFLGWYKSDTLISTDQIYGFRVEENVDLAGNFEGNRPTISSGAYELTVKAGEGGKIVTGASGYYAERSRTPLEAAADSGYQFINWTSTDGGTFDNAASTETIFTMPQNATTVTANFTPGDPDDDPTKSSLPYMVRITTKSLNIRKDPGTEYEIIGRIKDKGIYVIIEESSGTGANLWGKLRRGGWITLDYTEPYRVRIIANSLNIRSGAGTNYIMTGAIEDKGIYTIVEESRGEGARLWGKLKSGAGWISLDHTVVFPVCPYPEPMVKLQKGSKGEGVFWVQWYFNQMGITLAVDGIFGSLMHQEVCTFQRNNSLAADGIVGFWTRSKLKGW
ncbi:MAG: peptidoglycan-binding protein [Peptococcaceae bacterium]|nr:peptidoglycan-binding protein [Peptococcaceae bacterium]